MTTGSDEAALFTEDSQELLFPTCQAIPIGTTGFTESRFETPNVTYLPSPGWRALNLVCLSVEYLPGRPWYDSCAWYSLWRRRLKRAPVSTNNNKRSELA
jgi:hypothetical protein